MRIRPALVTAALAAGLVLSPALAPPSHAQYIYLDSNGDGVHTDADLLAADGTTTVDIWLATDRTRQGADVVCVTEPGTSFTINSYEVILHAVGGIVRYGAFENAQATMTTRFGLASDSTDLYAGYGGITSYPAGLYRLGSVTVETIAGAPSLEFATSTSLLRWYETAFGSKCPGNDYDNTLKLGSDWFDADGLRAAETDPNPDNLPPEIEPIAPITLLEGEVADRMIRVSDPDSHPLSLEVLESPRYATIGAATLGEGSLETPLRLAPGYLDAGSSRVVVRASDGVNRASLVIYVTVVNVDRAPVIDPIDDQFVEFGDERLVPVTARDPDPGTLDVRIAGAPAFVTLNLGSSGSGTYQGTLRIAPTERDVGRWTVTLAAQQGSAMTEETFELEVPAISSHHPPVLDSIPDVSVAQGGDVQVEIHAVDPDGDLEVRKVEGPGWLWILPGGWSDVDQARSWHLFGHAPESVLGVWRVTVEATDGVLSASRSFEVAVTDSAFAPRLSGWEWGCAAQGEARTYSVRATDFDGDLASFRVGELPRWVSATEQPDFVWTFTLAPTSDDLPGTVPIALTATDATGLVTEGTFEASIVLPGECDPGGPLASDPDRPPAIALAGGPYAGIAGVRVHLDGSASQNVLDRQYRWSFGDGGAGLGRAIGHVYAEGGTYQAVLCIYDRHDSTSACDTAIVAVRDALPARAYQGAEETPIVLRASRAAVTLRMERIGEEYALEDLVPSSLCLRAPGHGAVDSIFAVDARAPKSVGLEDRDRNGVPERGVSFARDDLRSLLSDVRGKRTIHARLEARLPSGARVRAPIELVVLGTPPKGVAIWPNPLNPRGTITFAAERPGRAVVRLFDVNGRLVRTLLDDAVEAGEVRVPFDGRDAEGRPLASGVYFYRVNTAEGEWRGRATILK